MEQVEALLRLPFETLALISAGYLSYRLAYVGKDGTHSTVDVIFATLVFAFVAKLTAGVLAPYFTIVSDEARGSAAAVIGVAISILVAALWRKWGEPAAFWVLRKFGISAADRQIMAWQTLLARPPKKGPTRLYIRCHDGTRLLCEKLADFNEAPLGPCLLGQDGSVGVYVTHRKSDLKGEWQTDNEAESFDPEWGYSMTFIPASQIAEVRIDYPFTPSVLGAGASKGR